MNACGVCSGPSGGIPSAGGPAGTGILGPIEHCVPVVPCHGQGLPGGGYVQGPAGEVLNCLPDPCHPNVATACGLCPDHGNGGLPAFTGGSPGNAIGNCAPCVNQVTSLCGLCPDLTMRPILDQLQQQTLPCGVGSTCGLTGITATIDPNQAVMFPSTFSAHITIKNSCGAPAYVTVSPDLPSGANAVCQATGFSSNVDSGALGNATWVMLPTEPAVPINGVAGPELDLTWLFTPDHVGACDVKAKVTDTLQNAIPGNQPISLEKIIHVIPQVNATVVGLGGLTANDAGWQHWDEVDQNTPAPPLPEVDVHMAGALAVVPVTGTVQTTGLDWDEWGHFWISPTVPAATLQALYPDCAALQICGSLDASLDAHTDTPVPLHIAGLTQVQAGSTATVCLHGQYMEESSPDDDGQNCVVLHGIHDPTLALAASLNPDLPVAMMMYVVPH
jgi:hypothetical protein